MKLSKSEQFKVVEDYLSRELSMLKYSKGSEYSVGQINYWLQKYKKEKEPNKTIFVEVKPHSKPTFSGITIKYPNGVIIETPQNISFDQLSELITLQTQQ